MDLRRVQPDALKLEVRQLSGPDIRTAQKKASGGAFGRLMSNLGRFVGAVAAPLSIFFPPALIGAAAAYGVSQIGDMVQVSAMRKQMQPGAGGDPMANSFLPGLNQVGMDLTQDSNRAFNPMQQVRDEQAMNILVARDDMAIEAAHAMEAVGMAEATHMA